MNSTELLDFVMGNRRMILHVFPGATVKHWFRDGICDFSKSPLLGPGALLVIKIEVSSQGCIFCVRQDLLWQLWDYNILMPSVPVNLASKLARDIATHAMPKDE